VPLTKFKKSHTVFGLKRVAPKGEDLRHWFVAKAIFDSETAERDCGGGEVGPHGVATEPS
jgi:hypothetical protein